MAKLLISTFFLVLAGCAGGSPEKIFRNSLHAFADGEIERGTRYFSERLLNKRPISALKAYYGKQERCQAIAFLLKGHSFRLIKVEPIYAVGEVTWSTGRTEAVYFVRENGDWKLDLPPPVHDKSSMQEQSHPHRKKTRS